MGLKSAAGAARLITDWSIFSGTKVLVISVAPMQPPWWTGLREMAVPDTVDAFDDIVGRSHDCHERVATDWTGRISDHGIDAESMRRKGDPAAEIIAAAGAWDADLIIMGTRGITGVRRAMLGSVARNVLAHAPCSVLVVRASAAVETTLAPMSTVSASGGGSSSTT